MKKNKLFAVFGIIALLAVVVLTGCSSKETLYIYSWSDNFDPEVLVNFEKEFNVKVVYDSFSSNEDLLAKMQAGNFQYDIIQPSDYMVDIMVKLGYLAELNKANIPNLSNMNPTFTGLPFDPENKYSIVYMYGVTGIAYNTKYVTDEITSWEDLWDPKYAGRVVLLNDSREVFGMALKKLGYSPNSTNEAELQEALAELKKLSPNVLAFDTDDIKQKFMSEEAWIGTMWSGDAAYANDENEDIAYVVPTEGATIFYDTTAIPKGAKNKELAEKFINYLLDPEVSAQNYEWLGYGNPNQAAEPFQSEEFKSNPFINLPAEDLARTESLIDIGAAKELYDRYWTELKSGR